MTVLDMLATTAAPWAHLYSNSKSVAAGVAFLHVGGLVFGGGRAITADCKTLAVKRNAAAERELDEILVNGALLSRDEAVIRSGKLEPARGWSRLKIRAGLSLALWFGTMLVGNLLTSA